MTLLLIMTLLLLFVKSLFVFALSGAALLCLRRASASARHLVCLLTLAALLALPLCSLTLPGWQVAGLQTRDAEAAPHQEPTPAQAPVLPNREGGEFEQEAHLASAASSSGSSLAGRTPAKQGGGFLTQGGGLLTFYLLGVLLASLRPLLGLWGIAHLRRACIPATDAPTLGVRADCAAALRLKRLPLLCRADIPVPMTWGWHCPMVVLPLGFQTWPVDRLRSVLLHEMAHVKRRDWPCHRLADIACALYWFHPLVWLTARRLRSESEAACDDLVLSSGIAAPDYARHLLEIAQALPPASRQSHAAIAMAQTSRLEGRITMVLDKTRTRRTVARRVLLIALVPSTAALIMLAVLRPAVKAQTAANEPLPSTSSALLYTTDAGVKLTVASDMTIDGVPLLAGMTDAVEPQGRWWNPQGALLSTPAVAANAFSVMQPLQNEIIRQIAFRLPSSAKGATVQYKLPQSTGYSSDGAWPGKNLDQTGQTEAQMFAHSGGARIVTAQYPASLTKADIQVGLASGAWRTTAVETRTPGALDPFGGTSGSMSGNQTFIMSRPAQTAEGCLLTVSTDTEEDVRVVAVDAQGREVLPNSIGGQSVNKLDQISAQFSLPLSQVKEFRMETRPFQWIEYKDVALKPVQ